MRSKVTPRWLKLSEGSRKADGCLLPNASSTPSISPARRATTAMWAPAAGMPLVVWDWVSKNIAPPSAPKYHLKRLSRTWATDERSECADWASSKWAAATTVRATNGRARERMRMGLPPNEDSNRAWDSCAMESGAAGRPVSPEHGKARAASAGRPQPLRRHRAAPRGALVTYYNKTGYGVNVERLGRGVSAGPKPPGGPWPSETHPFGKRREGQGSDQPELISDPPKGRGGRVEVVALVARRDLTADPRRTLRHDRVAEPGDEDALVEEHFAHPDRGRGLADDHRDDRSVSGERLEAELEEAAPEVGGVLAQPSHAFRVRSEELDRGEGRARGRGAAGGGAGRRVAKGLGPGGLGGLAAGAARPRDEPPRRAAQRLAER